MRFHLLSQSAVRIVAIGGVTLLITAVYLSRFRPYALAGGRLWGDVTSHPAPDALTWNALAARVDEALTRAEMVPILSVEEGWEQSRKTCDPRPEQANGPRTQWAGITSETLFQKRQQVFDGVRAYFDFNQANISEAVNTLHFGSRRGIVYTGGNLVSTLKNECRLCIQATDPKVWGNRTHYVDCTNHCVSCGTVTNALYQLKSSPIDRNWKPSPTPSFLIRSHHWAVYRSERWGSISLLATSPRCLRTLSAPSCACRHA